MNAVPPLPAGPAAAPGAAWRPANLVLGFTALILLLIWSAILHEVGEDRAEAMQEWTRNLANLTRAFSEHTLRSLDVIDRDVRFVRTLYLEPGGRLDLQELVREGGVDGTYGRLSVVGGDGRYVLSTRAPHPASARDLAEFDAQKQARGDAPMLGVPGISRSTGRWTMHLTRRVTGADGAFAGLAVASFDPQHLGDLYTEVDLGKNGTISLVGGDGVMRARMKNGAFSMGQNIAGSQLYRKSRLHEIGSFVAIGRVDGLSRLFSFRRLPGYDVTVVTSVSTRHVYEHSRETALTYITIGALATVIIMLFAGFILRLLRRQEHHLLALRESQAQAESANHLKSEFLASMSHELRTPLNGILGFADILRQKGPDEKTRRQAGIIHSSGSHLLAILNSILDIAKIEAGKMDVNLRDEDLPALVRGTAQVHEVTALGRGLRLEVGFEAELPARIRCDGMLLRQVLNNLLSNAIKFTERGSVTLKVERDFLDRDLLYISVADTGMGIGEEALKLVFEKFRQADQSLTRAHQGTGLGLTLAKQLVELMGGFIGLHSVEGEGTTIHFTLPIAPSGRPAGVAAPGAGALSLHPS